ncbi:MAG: hypothetical protein ED558_14050 [Oricola sp.]|nr:MAG: hypothetical protein ED558_14050 [Oricola sp.]
MTRTTPKANPVFDRVAEARAIKAKVVQAGLSFAQIDRTYKLSAGTARQALREPNPGGERAIAAALGTKPHLLWPSRYRPSGQRRSQLDWNKIRLTGSTPKRAGAQT